MECSQTYSGAAGGLPLFSSPGVVTGGAPGFTPLSPVPGGILAAGLSAVPGGCLAAGGGVLEGTPSISDGETGLDVGSEGSAAKAALLISKAPKNKF